MPSEPKPKPLPLADEPPKTHVQAADAARKDGVDLPEGASVGKPPTEGLWDALVGPDGEVVQVDGNPVRVPIA